MPIQYEPSVGEQLAPAAEAFAQGLEKFMKPNHDFQIAMQKAVGGNPKLAQDLADLEYNAPGTLDRMGFGNLGRAISQIPESEKSTLLRTSRGEILKQDQQKLQLEGTQTGFDIGRLNDTINFLKDPANKAVTSDMILKRLTGQTYGERAETAARTDEATARAGLTRTEGEVAAAKAPEEIARANVGRKAFDSAMANMPNLKDTDFLGTARDFLAGRADGATMAALFNTPGAQEAMSKAIGAVEEERQIALREHLAAMHETRSDKSADALTTREAFARYQATKGAGTLDAWRTILTDPHKVEEIKKKNPKDLTQDERDILHAASAQDKLQDMQNVTEARTINTDIRHTVDDISRIESSKGKDPGAVSTLISNLNNQLDQKSQVTGRLIRAEYGPRPPVGESTASLASRNSVSHWWAQEGTGLYFVGEDGKRINDSEVQAEPKIGANKMSANALRAYTQLMGKPTAAERTASLEALKTANPTLYNEVKPFIQ